MKRISDMVNYTSNEPMNKQHENQYKKRGDECMYDSLNQEKSIYVQIAEMVETDILRGILLEEERAPSTNELAKQYAINPATAAKGINILVDEEILYKKRGIGMFVSTGAKEKILTRRRGEFYENYIKKLLKEAESIGLDKEQVIDLIKGEKA